MYQYGDEKQDGDPRDEKYWELYGHVMSYLATYCEHEWVEDSIDVDPEHSQQIVYCTYCETTK